MITVKDLNPHQWRQLSYDAHKVVFGEHKPAEVDRIDGALLAVNEHEVPLGYVTYRALDSTSLYWQFGGMFPGTKDTIRSVRATEAMLAWVKQAGYRRVSCLIENTNLPMLKMAMKMGFLISGVKLFKGSILVEHLLEFEGG